VKQPLWQRRRSAQADKDAATRADDAPKEKDGREGKRQPSDIRARLREIENESRAAPPADEATATNRQAAYAAWADRMRSHKRDKLADITPEPGAKTTSPYWDSSTLFAQPDPDAKPAADLLATDELLGVLGLAPGADTAEVQAAFRRLAKEHHPDRWHNAEPEIRAEHEAHMALIVEAHRELRRRMR
jgi:hypothetical protein